MMPLNFISLDRKPSEVGSPTAIQAAMARAVGPFRGKSRIFGFTVLLCLLAAIYWGVIASDRYVSEAHVIIQQTEMPMNQSMDISTLFGGSGGASRADQMLLRDHLLSVDMLTTVDAGLGLKEHYSDRRRDPLSRLWSADISQEWFHWYYLSRVSVEFDDYAGVLIIRSEAFTPDKAHALTSLLVQEGERYMNLMARRLAQEQLSFVEKQVNQMNDRLIQARQAVLAYQNKRNLVSPQGTVENLFGIINQLEGQLTTLKTQLDALLGFQNARSPAVIELNLQIAAVQKQMTRAQARLTSSERQTLNRAVEEYQLLEMNAGFAQDLYKTALAALEKRRVDAARTLKMVSVLQSPTHPEYPLQPRRIYNTVVFVLGAFLLAGIVSLLSAIIRDHRD